MDIMELATSMDVGWTLVAAALVFFMQASFAMVETGFTRAKNAGNIIMKNLMDFSLGTPIFWILGFGIMFGAASPFFGGFDFFADGVVGEGLDDPDLPDRILCNCCDHRFRFDGRAYQILCILHLLDDYFCGHLPGFRSLDLGRRLARRAWLP